MASRPRAIRKSRSGAGVDALGDEGLADAAGEDEGRARRPRPSCPGPCGRPGASAPNGLAGELGQARRQAGGGDGARRRARRPAPEQRPSAAEKRNARAQPSATASPCFSASPKPVSASSAWPKVWPRLSRARRPRLALVLGDDLGLHLHRAARRRGPAPPRRGPAPPAPFASSQSKKAGVAQQAVLDAPRRSRRRISRSRQGRQHVEVGQHQPRLVEGADQVLAARRVDGGLAADRGVDLGQQRGRDLHEVDAALVDRRREAGEVADHPAAEGDDQVAAVQLQRQQRVAERFQAGEALGLLARRDGDHVRRRRPAAASDADQPLAVQAARPSRRRPRRRAAASAAARCSAPAASIRPGADHHLIGAVAQADGDGARLIASDAARAARVAPAPRGSPRTADLVRRSRRSRPRCRPRRRPGSARRPGRSSTVARVLAGQQRPVVLARRPGAASTSMSAFSQTEIAFWP